MGFDIVHMNLHKTFAVPHGGGGPGAGPVAVSPRLAEFLPGPVPERDADGSFAWSTPARSIGRVHGWHGNALALARAWSYILANGGDGLRRVAEGAVLNANWLRHQLRGVYDLPYDRPNMHEFVASTTSLKKAKGVRALDVGKRLLEEGFHAPTVYFPLIVDEALMIEPTETESPQTRRRPGRGPGDDRRRPRRDAGPAPRTTPVGRVDEARAARILLPTWDAVVAADGRPTSHRRRGADRGPERIQAGHGGQGGVEVLEGAGHPFGAGNGSQLLAHGPGGLVDPLAHLVDVGLHGVGLFEAGGGVEQALGHPPEVVAPSRNWVRVRGTPTTSAVSWRAQVSRARIGCGGAHKQRYLQPFFRLADLVDSSGYEAQANCRSYGSPGDHAREGNARLPSTVTAIDGRDSPIRTHTGPFMARDCPARMSPWKSRGPVGPD